MVEELPDEKLCKRLKAAIEDEQRAVDEYTELSMKSRWTRRPYLSREFAKIAEDEKRHHQKLTVIAEDVCPT